MKCIIVDDEEMSRVSLQYLCNRVEGLEIVAICETAVQAMKVLREKDVDLVFLDIQMPHISGMEIVRELNTLLPQIVFITSQKDYAHEAFEYEVTDFLLKPITYPRFLKSIERARRKMND